VALRTASDILELTAGERLTRRSVSDLVQHSKVEGSSAWAGPAWAIGNTPQQGINWIGRLPSVRGVIIKTTPGAYAEDGWIDGAATQFRYSFKARKGVVSSRDTANRVLVEQPSGGYPVLLLIGEGSDWGVSGWFDVRTIGERSVILLRRPESPLSSDQPEDMLFPEGSRRYVMHLRSERSRAAVDFVKGAREWICEICSKDFEKRYGVRYIEAHHKVPMAAFTGEFETRSADLALLCPDCHRAVHRYMKLGESDFETLKQRLRSRLTDVSRSERDSL
jgi:putative restriction endonuclease